MKLYATVCNSGACKPCFTDGELPCLVRPVCTYQCYLTRLYFRDVVRICMLACEYGNMRDDVQYAFIELGLWAVMCCIKEGANGVLSDLFLRGRGVAFYAFGVYVGLWIEPLAYGNDQ